MKSILRASAALAFVLELLVSAQVFAQANNVTGEWAFTVTTDQGGGNPVITLKRGRAYTFLINADFNHPFEILDAPPGSVTNNNISQGILTFAVPLTPVGYRYQCSVHPFMTNAIITVP